jgi:hypothetical protein
VLKNNRYIIEPNDRATRKNLLEIPVVREAYDNAIKFNSQEEERKKANLSFDQFYQGLSVEKRALYDRLLDKRSLTEQNRLKAGATNGYTNVSKTQQDLA